MDKKLKKLNESLALIEKKTIVLNSKQENIERLACLHDITRETKTCIRNFKQKISIEKTKEKYEKILQKARLQQLQMLHLIEKLESLESKQISSSKFLPDENANKQGLVNKKIFFFNICLFQNNLR